LNSWLADFSFATDAGATSSAAIMAQASQSLDQLREVKALADDVAKALSYALVGSPIKATPRWLAA